MIPTASAKTGRSFRSTRDNVTIYVFPEMTGSLCSSFAYLNRYAVHIVAETTSRMTHDRHPIDHCVTVFDPVLPFIHVHFARELINLFLPIFNLRPIFFNPFFSINNYNIKCIL